MPQLQALSRPTNDTVRSVARCWPHSFLLLIRMHFRTHFSYNFVVAPRCFLLRFGHHFNHLLCARISFDAISRLLTTNSANIVDFVIAYSRLLMRTFQQGNNLHNLLSAARRGDQYAGQCSRIIKQ